MRSQANQENNWSRPIPNKVKKFLCNFDYISKFTVLKWAEKLSTDRLITCCKIIFAEYGLLKTVMPGMGTTLFQRDSEISA